MASFEEAIAAIRDGYLKQCALDHREPDWDYFESLAAATIRGSLRRGGQT